jgi:signal transduction histidine kinase
VSSSDADGRWNGAEADLSFQIEPALWQTWWFRLSCVLSLMLAAWLFYLVRMQQITRQLSIRFEERLSERMRIAQELHDTLLQGFISASMQLHLAVDQVPESSPVKPLLSRVLRLMAQVTEEGRTTLRGIRSTVPEPLDLVEGLSRIPEEMVLGNDTAFRVIVDGVPKPLHPVVRDEVYRIGREALVNAFRHAHASSVEVQVEYTAGHLQIVIRDDGCGIDPQVLNSGREGHWGIAGMRERAQRMGGTLRMWSRATAGTEVQLSVPAHVAYQLPPRSSLMRKLLRPYSRFVNAQKSGGNLNQ